MTEISQFDGVEQREDVSFVQPQPKTTKEKMTYLLNKNYPIKYFLVFLLVALASNEAFKYFTKPGFESVNFINYPLWNMTTESMDPTIFGRWEAVIPDMKLSASYGENLGMQTVHSAILPSGKVLFASGSSWRNFKGQTQLFPQYQQPKGHQGLFRYQTFILTGNKTEDDAKLFQYFTLTNNVGIYDPVANTFFRIPHPAVEVYNNNTFEPNDFFCIGHNHLPDGNVLFTGGTQYYYPMRNGARTTYVFNWTKAEQTNWAALKNWGFDNWDQVIQNKKSKNFYPWIFTGLMKQGRWYPSIVPLHDHKLIVVAGYRGNFSAPFMYPYEMNQILQVFDYAKFKSNPLTAWTAFNLEKTPNSPFTTRLAKIPPAGDCNAQPPAGMDRETFLRRCNNYQYDAFKLYPQNYLIKEDQIFITHEGDWNSLRETFSCCIRLTKRTYYMNMVRSSNNQISNITFEKACDDPNTCPQFYRQSYVTMSGTTTEYRDPDTNDQKKIFLFGGMQLTTGGTMAPGLVSIDDWSKNKLDVQIGLQYVGSRGSRKLQRFDMNEKVWKKINETYLGATYADDRTMHYSLLLPNKQILIVNGGNYDYFGPVYSPLLLTPKKNLETGELQFDRAYMAPARKGKLYHNVALLLRDGSIITSGGNAARALVNKTAPLVDKQKPTQGQHKFNTQKFDVNVFFKTDSSEAIGHNVSPAESMYAEIYKPSYLYIDPERTMTVSLNNPYKRKIVGAEQYFLVKSNIEYTLNVVSNVDFKDFTECADQQSIVLMKLSSSTHGWDSGQSLFSLPFKLVNSRSPRSNTFQFRTPDARKQLLAPAFYHLFYIDCKGKPARSLMLRFDDYATTVL